METLEASFRRNRELMETYDQFSQLDRKTYLYSTPESILIVGGIGVAIKIATGDEILAQNISNQLVGGLYVTGILSGLIGIYKALNIETNQKGILARKIVELEGGQIEEGIVASNREGYRILGVTKLASHVSPGLEVTLWNKYRFTMAKGMTRFMPRLFSQNFILRDNIDEQNRSINTMMGTAASLEYPDEMKTKALELGIFRWIKIGLHDNDPNQREYAGQMIFLLAERLNGIESPRQGLISSELDFNWDELRN